MVDVEAAKRISFELMPVTFQALVVESTSICNAKCAMCYQSAGPKGSDVWGRSSLSSAEIETVVRDAAQIETLTKRFHLSGGEAFIKANDCLALFAVAREAGFTDITTTTNAYWARDLGKALKMCEQLRAAGLTRMEISWDFWHQPYIPGDAVSNALEACAEHDIHSVLRILSTKSHSVAEALSAIREPSLSCATEIFTCPVFPVGRAAREIDPDDIYYGGDLAATCHSILNLTVNAWGNVYPCCAGSDQTDWLTFGNVRERPICDIAREMNRSRLLRMLVFEGAQALVPILRRAGFKMDGKYSNICHLCFDIFSKEEHARPIQEFFEELENGAILRALEYLKKSLPTTDAALQS
jgi:MoaA/NifB/PqqE/SkfB family radical SAM enzyme